KKLGGAASLARLREARLADRVAQFQDAEVYRVERAPPECIAAREGSSEKPASENGGWSDPAHDCVEVDPSTPPLVYHASRERIDGLKFIAETPLGELDEALVVELSDDLRSWRVAPHAPLLST